MLDNTHNANTNEWMALGTAMQSVIRKLATAHEPGGTKTRVPRALRRIGTPSAIPPMLPRGIQIYLEPTGALASFNITSAANSAVRVKSQSKSRI